MKFLGKLRKKSEGFTLVELIVVLIILAILAAFTIPAMLGFVNEARDKAFIAQAREVYVAAQSVATEQAVTNPADWATLGATLSRPVAADPPTNAAMARMIGNDIDATATWTVTLVPVVDGNPPDGNVDAVAFTVNGRTITIDPGEETTIV